MLMVARWSPKPKVGVQILLGLPVAGVGLHVAVSNPSEGRANPLGPARSVGVDLLVAVSNPAKAGQILLGLPGMGGQQTLFLRKFCVELSLLYT